MADGKTRYADDATLEYIAKLEAELAEVYDLLMDASPARTFSEKGRVQWQQRKTAFLRRQEAKQ